MIANITILFVALCIGFIGRRIYENHRNQNKPGVPKKKK